MNLYFLVEGAVTEMEVYPRWIDHLLPHLKQVERADEATDDTYFIVSPGGYDSMLSELGEAFETVNTVGKYDFLILVTDTETLSSEERIEEIREFIADRKLRLKNAELVIITQQCCIETWFLGNRTFCKKEPSGTELKKYFAFFNAWEDDPEMMEKPKWFRGSRAKFHESYLKLVFQERLPSRVHYHSYDKSNPRYVQQRSFLNQLQRRVADEPSHLKSFQNFLEFCARLRPEAA
jgi:hypothetical protein